MKQCICIGWWQNKLSIASSDGREVVHHLDEDKSNNSPENLVVCSSASVHRRPECPFSETET
ncbi:MULTISPECIES: HNH endonuclease [unclassified Microcoleus]|uniref:HNH endonuclease n=1 Tax=unclassified Microcoleus TaxID=2642155 RepID=UPI00404094EC